MEGLAKRSLSLLLSLVMILGMMAAIQTPALAADDVDADINAASPANTVGAARVANNANAARAANNAGTVLGSFGSRSFPSGGNDTIGDGTWTDYVIETAITLDNSFGQWPGGKIILRKDGANFYFIELQESGTISLKKSTDYNNAIQNKYMGIPGVGEDAVGKKIYYRVTVTGADVKVETSLTGFDSMTLTLEVNGAIGDLLTGGAGVDFYNIAANVESFAVRQQDGTPLGSFGSRAYPSGGNDTIGNNTWKNYVIETAITLDNDFGADAGGKIILRKYNDGSIFYYVELTKTGTISLKKAPQWGTAIEGEYVNIAAAGGDAVGKKIYYRVTVEGYDFKVETSLTGFDNMTTTLEVSDTAGGDLPTGGAGVDFYNIAANVDGFTVYKIGTVTPLNGVSISGVAQVGETLTAEIDPSDATATYEWFSGGASVGTGGSYVVAQSDLGKTIKVVATATDDFSGTVESAPTAAVIAATGLPLLTVALDMNIDTISDGKIKVSSVTAPTGSKRYYVLGVEQAKPVEGTNISTIAGAAELTLNTEIGTNVNRTQFINVYDVAANGEIVAFGKLPIPYNGIGTILIAETDYGDLSRGAVRTMGSDLWTNYIIEADISVSSVNPGGSAGYGGVQLFFRHTGADNTTGTTLFGAVTFDKTVALQCSPYVDANCAYAGKLDLDTSIHMKITVDGKDFKVEATPPTGTGATQTASKTLTSFPYGKVGYRLENVDGSINNYTVRRIRKADDPVIVDGKTKITNATVYSIKTPVAGNYPTSLYQFPNQEKKASANVFEQTITWSPEIPKVFATNTAYTATLRLHPRSAAQTFNDVALADITGLPTVGVSGTPVVEYDGDDMLIHIAFNATGSANAAPVELFRDDFDGTSLNTSKWDYCPQDTRQGRSTWRNEMVSVSGGNLRLGIEKSSQYAPQGTAQDLLDNWINGGAVRTRKQSGDQIIFENGYGYYEARMKLPKISGTWGAFWLMSPTEELVGNDGVDGTEIDIVETIDNRFNGFNAALHWDGYADDHRMDNSGTKTLATSGVDIYDGEFHTFAVDWSPTEYVFYVDDIVFWRTDAQPQGVKPGINQNPNYIKLTTEGSDIAGVLPAGFTSGEVLVDYVYVLNQPKQINITEDADNYVNVTMAPSFNAARDVWLIEATVVNKTPNAYFGGTIAVENSSGIVKTATQEFDIIAPGATRKVYFEVNPFYNFTSAAYDIVYSYTLSNNHGGSGTYRLGMAAALKTNGAITIDGNMSEAVWQTAPVIDFAKATPPATATAKLAWDSTNLYVAAEVADANHVQTAANGDIINGDSVQVLVGNKNLAFALKGSNVIAYDLTANKAAAIKAAIANTAGATKYEIAIPWSYLGVNGGSLSHGSLLDFALIVNDNDGAGSTASSYFTQANMGALVLSEHVIIPKHVVSFNSNGGSLVPFADVADNGKLTAPTPPTRPGYDFEGWFKDTALTNPWNFANDTVTGDITLYAKWKRYYSVFFEPLGGTAVSPVKSYGTAINPPAPPTRDGFTFVGWYTTEALTTLYNFGAAVTSNVTLYAKWTLAPGKVDAATMVLMQLSWHYDAANFKKVISTTLTNIDSVVQSGTVKITAPIGITQGTAQTFSLEPGASIVLNFDIIDGYTPQRDIETVIADYTAGDNGVGSASVKLGFVEAELVSAKPVIDGDLDDSAWQTGNAVDLGAGSSSLGNPARNYMDTSGTAKLRWDKEYLYVALDVQTNTHNMSASQASGIWDYDSVQLLLKNSAGNYKEVGFALNDSAKKILAYSWADTINGATGVGEISASNATAVIVRNNTSKTTTYEIALKWDYMLGSSRSDMKIGDILEVCILLNDRDSTGRRYISYFDGIASTKGIGVGKLLLSAQQTTTPVNPPAPPPSNQSSNSSSQYTPAPVVSSLSSKSSDTLVNALKAAEKAGGESLGLTFKNVSEFTKENAAAIIKRAKELGKTASVSSDTMSIDNKYVEVRVTINPELLNQTIKLDGYIRSDQVQVTESKFKKFFENKTAVIRLGQAGAFGQTAKIAARIDLAGFEAKNLCFYIYDKKTNSYSRIINPAHWVDKNGYLHFETAFGGDIIISNGPLVRK